MARPAGTNDRRREEGEPSAQPQFTASAPGSRQHPRSLGGRQRQPSHCRFQQLPRKGLLWLSIPSAPWTGRDSLRFLAPRRNRPCAPPMSRADHDHPLGRPRIFPGLDWCPEQFSTKHFHALLAFPPFSCSCVCFPWTLSSLDHFLKNHHFRLTARIFSF